MSLPYYLTITSLGKERRKGVGRGLLLTISSLASTHDEETDLLRRPIVTGPANQGMVAALSGRF
jgi:hypothetical protein